MLFLRGVGMAIGGFFMWIAFVVVPPWLCGWLICRHNAWWTPADRLRGFITLRSERLQRVLVPVYIGWNSFLPGSLPVLCNRYTINKYPERLSVLGALNYFLSGLTALAYAYCVTDFLFIRLIDPNWALYSFFALALEAIIFLALGSWNTSERKDPVIVITRRGMREIRAARRAKRSRERKH